MASFPQRSNLAPVREICIKLICTFVTVLKNLDTFARVVNLISNKQELFLRSTLVLVVNPVECPRTARDYCYYRLLHLKDNREMPRDKCIQTAELRFRNVRTSCHAVESFYSRFNQNIYHSNLIGMVVADPGIFIQKVNVTS